MKEHFGNCKNANLLSSIKSEKHKEWKKQYIANQSANLKAKKPIGAYKWNPAPTETRGIKI